MKALAFVGFLVFGQSLALAEQTAVNHYEHFRYVECYSQTNSTSPIARMVVADYNYHLAHPAVNPGEMALIATLDREVVLHESQHQRIDRALGETLAARVRAAAKPDQQTFHLVPFKIIYGAPLVSLKCVSQIVVSLGEAETEADAIQKWSRDFETLGKSVSFVTEHEFSQIKLN